MVVETSRINGFLNMREYLERRYGNSYLYLAQLESDGIIEFKTEGISDGFWILDNSGYRIALFKESQNNSYEHYAELISEEICKVLSIKTAHYDLAILDEQKGVLTTNFVEEYDDYISGEDILMNFYEDRLYNKPLKKKEFGLSSRDGIEEFLNKCNNLEDIWYILDDYFSKKCPSYREVLIKKFMESMVSKLIFDILTINIDDHPNNWALVNFKMAPMFDNCRILRMHTDILDKEATSCRKIEKEKLYLLAMRKGGTTPIDLLKNFLQISGSEYKDLVYEKITCLQDNLDNIITNVETRTNYPLPNSVKSYITIILSKHLNALRNAFAEEEIIKIRMKKYECQ